ncbi:centrosomal protein of 152 kDa isoform X8 [Syngnathus scovelli]|uniref:centrosomal protein of 152 kDa isoform X8 n=1 Tax=Syngnathus scovelli TaxID=161590 RepID=UPI00210FE3FD|nr:centrosomal protein of 152 kDa isoform X8 [Syngnathus scovelli]
MSIDFDTAALQTQDDEEEYDQDDLARKQELHNLLANMPDDMLEDSRDSSCTEQELINRNAETSPQSKCTQQRSDHPRPNPHEQSYEEDYGHHDFTYEDGGVQSNGHSQPLAHIWNQHSDSQFTQEDCTQNSMGTERSSEANGFSTDDPYEPHLRANNIVNCNGDGTSDCNNPRVQSQPGAVERRADDYRVSYNPHCPPRQMLSSQATHQERPFDQLQREFLDSTQQTAEKEQITQLQIFNVALKRQNEDLEQKFEDSKRNTRYLEHQLAIAKDQKNDLAASLKESTRLLGEAKERELQMQSKLKTMEQQIQTLNERDQENTKKQRVAEAAVDTMKQQMLELCRSDTLSKSRKQHDRDLTVIKEQHEAALLVLQQQLDAKSQALEEQMDTSQKFREQVKQLERQREEEQLERARVVNALTQSLEKSQQQCAKLLQTSSVQEMSQIQIKLQQAQTAKVLSDNMNRDLQEDLADLKEQIMLYESALKHGVIALEPNWDCQNQLSESCLALGFKKTNGSLRSVALAALSDSQLPQDEALRQLQVEMQRCLGSLKSKRQKISHLQEELQQSRARADELQNQLDEAKLSSSVRQSIQVKHPNLTAEDQNELVKLQEDKQRLQYQVEGLQSKIAELQQSEEKVRSANSELCVKTREMIQELHQEKQAAAKQSERINQQHRDDVVKRVRTELMLQHNDQLERLTAQHERQIQDLNSQLSEASDKVLAVQECYISVCKEKEILEESIRNKATEDALKKENEKKGESSTDVEKLRTELEVQHQASIAQLKALWSKEKEAEIQQQVKSHIALAKAAWDEARHQMEKTWTLKLEEARQRKQPETSEATCQTEETEANALNVTVKELDSKLCAQRQQLQAEADKVQRRAVEEARKQVQMESQEKHLHDLANKVEGAVTRAYNRWIEDLPSLPQYQALLQREKEKWEELQKQDVEQKISEAQLSCVLRETQEQHEREINKMQSSLAQSGGQVCSRKDCADTASKMDKKNQELQKHLAKACRQFQHSVREHKTTIQKLKDENERRLQKANEEHLLQLEEVKRSKEDAGFVMPSNHQQTLQEGLEEMKQQYLTTVEKIRGDMLRYLQESRERAAEMIRTEVLRERQDTARKMRRYYLTCLQELLEDDGKTTGRAEKKIMNAASKLAAMAKVLETPVKNKSGKNHALPTGITVMSTTGPAPASKTDFLKNPSSGPLDKRTEDRTHRKKMSGLEQKTTQARTKLVNNQDSADVQLYPHKVASSCSAPLRSKNREAYLQGGQPESHADTPNEPCVTQELPVRDDKRTNWSLNSSDSDSHHLPRVSYSGRKVESVKPFSVSARDFSQFDRLTPDTSDLTVYNDIAQENWTRTQTSAHQGKLNTKREPVLGSEGEKLSRPLFSELRQCQQDSGFDSPFNQPN